MVCSGSFKELFILWVSYWSANVSLELVRSITIGIFYYVGPFNVGLNFPLSGCWLFYKTCLRTMSPSWNVHLWWTDYHIDVKSIGSSLNVYKPFLSFLRVCQLLGSATRLKCFGMTWVSNNSSPRCRVLQFGQWMALVP